MSAAPQDAWALPGPAQPQGGLLAAGPDKLAQRAVIELLTEPGSLPYRPDRGTRFAAALRAGGAATETDLLTAFAASRPALLRALRADAGGRRDEWPRSVRATRLAVTPGAVLLTLDVAAASGGRSSLTAALTVGS